MNGLRVGVDYDGTVADTGAAKSAWIREHLGLDLPPWRTDRTLCVPIIGEEAYRRMGRAVYSPEATLSAAEVPGAADALRRLAEVATLYVVSARNHAQLAWAQQWLRDHGLGVCFAAHLSSAEAGLDGERPSKVELCLAQGIDVLIDDDQRHLGASEPGLCCIWLKHGCGESLVPNAGVEMAASWDEIVKMLADGGTERH